MEALLYTLGKHYDTLRLNLQRSEGANCGHFILLCLTGRHCTLFTPCSTLEASWGFTSPFHSHRKGFKSFISLQECEPQAGSTTRARGAAAQRCSWALLELPQQCGVGEGAVPLLPTPSLYPPAGAGQEGPAEPLWPKNAINEKPGEEQPCKLSWASSGRGAAGPSRGSHPLLPAPLTKKTLLLLQFRQLNWTSAVRWYE